MNRKQKRAWLWAVVFMAAGCGGDDTGNAGDGGFGVGNDFDGDGYTDAQEQSVGANIDSDNDGIVDWMDGDSHPVVLDIDGSACPSGIANASTTEPRVILVLDGSGSMDEALGGGGGGGGGGGSRWDAMRSALMDADGLVPRLESAVEFGMVLYSGSLGSLGGGGGGGGGGLMGCPDLVTTAPALNNYNAMNGALPGGPLGGSTPTHLALQHVLAAGNGLLIDGTNPDAQVRPQIMILATDGEPNNLCRGGMDRADPQAAADVVAAVQMARSFGMPTYVVSLAGNDQGLQAHLEQVALAGDTGMPPFVPQTRDDLIATLSQIVGGAIGCNLVLDGSVAAGMECSGSVRVNGQLLSCNTDYRLRDSRTIELVGQACMDFMGAADATISAEFPCGVFEADRPE